MALHSPCRKNPFLSAGDFLDPDATPMEPSAADVTPDPIVYLAPATKRTIRLLACGANCIVFVAGFISGLVSNLSAELFGRIFGGGLLSPPP